MTKRRAKNLFVVFAIILAILLVASFVNFTYPFSIAGNYYSYSNFISNLSLGQDIGSSVRILYRATQRDGQDSTQYSNLKQSTINQLIEIVQAYGYEDVTATTYGSDGILLQVGNIIDEDDVDTITSLIGEPVDISFGVSSSVDDAVIFASDVASVTMEETTYNSSTYYVYTIYFKDAADVYDKLYASDSSSTTIYGFLGDTTLISLELDELESIEENGYIQFYSSSITDRTTANQYLAMIKTGILDLELTQLECTTITATYGTWAAMAIGIVAIIAVLAMFIFLIAKYKQIGLVACFNLLFFITISLFIMQSIPLLHLNFSGMLALFIAFILVCDSLICIIEKAKQHYNQQTQLYVSFNMAKKETWARILISFSLMLFAGIVAVFMPSTAISSFGWAMLVLSIIGAFTSLALMRLFINMYLPLNPNNGEKCNFHKGGKNA